jgi:hypothetical protein
MQATDFPFKGWGLNAPFFRRAVSFSISTVSLVEKSRFDKKSLFKVSPLYLSF